jgi:CRISPR-associated protein Cmr4
MYTKSYGILETLAPLHVGASAGEEAGNLNLIFRDQFTQTGIIPGSSIRGRFRADIRQKNRQKNPGAEDYWYGKAIKEGSSETSEALVKFEYASIVWLPVFCPGQPVVWVSCPWLLKRYQQIAGNSVKLQDGTLLRQAKLPAPYTAPPGLQGRQVEARGKILFFNLGFLELTHEADLAGWVPEGVTLKQDCLVVVDDNDMAMIHDMALFRQSRVKLSDHEKKVAGGAFFNVEALPEGTVLVFPIALRKEKDGQKIEPQKWQPFAADASEPEESDSPELNSSELYFGGLESIGFGRCRVTLFQED